MKFSTIIPIYNAGQTLELCLKGFIHQEFTDFELILVNDGSTDNSAEICHRYVNLYPFIRMVDKPNGGVSSARNAGMKAAQGDFLTFADADDEVTPLFLAIFAEYCDECDMLTQSITQIDSEGNARSERLKDSIYNTAENMAHLVFTLYDKDIPISVWSSCFRRSVVEAYHIRFDEKIAVCEDVDFVLRYMAHSHRVRSTSKIGYHYNLPGDDKTYLEKNALRTSLKIIEDGFMLTNNETIRKGFQQRYVMWCMTELLYHKRSVESTELAAKFATFCLPYLRTFKPNSFLLRMFTTLCFNSEPYTILCAAKIIQFIFIIHKMAKKMTAKKKQYVQKSQYVRYSPQRSLRSRTEGTSATSSPGKAIL